MSKFQNIHYIIPHFSHLDNKILMLNLNLIVLSMATIDRCSDYSGVHTNKYHQILVF